MHLRQKIKNKVGITLGIFIILLLGMSFISAAPPQQLSDTTLVLESAYPTTIKLYEDYYIHTHLYDTANEVLITTGASCYYHFYNHQIDGGQHISTGNLTSYRMGYQAIVDGSLINESGEYSVLIWCNTSSPSNKIGFNRYTMEASPSGETLSSYHGFILIGLLGIIALFFGMARVFEKKKWKLRMGFDILALISSIVLANSIKLMASSSTNLGKMGDNLLILVITIVSLMIAYMLIMMTIEVVQYFKKENRKKWSMDTNAY